MANTPDEWMRQADYDIETAKVMFDSGRYFYAVFMCHLSVEKALKGAYMAYRTELPPRTHNLPFLANGLPLSFSEEQTVFLSDLSRASVTTRYPEEMDSLIAEFSESKTRRILQQVQEIVQWLKSELKRLQNS
jgi:HEPN domain-containing protein